VEKPGLRRQERHPEGGEGSIEEREKVREKVGLDREQLIFMLKGLVAAGLVTEIGRTTPDTIAIEYSITPAFKEMMNFLDSRNYLINRSEGEQDIPADAKKTSFRPCWKVHAPGKHAVDRRTGIYEMSSSK
jgi:hypothetical protein